MFNQYLIPLERIEQRAAQARERIAAQQGGDAGDYAAQVIAHRLLTTPERYVEFGPYWWSVKAALRRSGADFGWMDDALVRGAYGGALAPLEAFVAGELFKDMYLESFLRGAAQFWLDDGAEQSYVLFDPDMEARRLGRGGRRVCAVLAAEADDVLAPAAPEIPAAAT